MAAEAGRGAFAAARSLLLHSGLEGCRPAGRGHTRRETYGRRRHRRRLPLPLFFSPQD